MYSLAYVTSVAYNYWKTNMCRFELLQNDESGAKQADSSRACYQARACFIIVSYIYVSFHKLHRSHKKRHWSHVPTHHLHNLGSCPDTFVKFIFCSKLAWALWSFFLKWIDITGKRSFLLWTLSETAMICPILSFFHRCGAGSSDSLSHASMTKELFIMCGSSVAYFNTTEWKMPMWIKR